MSETMNGSSSESATKTVVDRQMGWGRQASMKEGRENGVHAESPVRTVTERQMGWGRQSSTASIREGLERQASVSSTGSTSRRWSPDPADKGEYRKLQNDMQIMTFKVKSLEEKVDKVVRG